ncbi:MAG: uracil-DNA glycosylase [Verrucomicrobia bacterium]|jgi:DNA polymerase|nr:uracil-DNA glycosylase [Verrucomicrobiota bacterium]
MVEDLSIIAEELRRLQRNGVERVFVDDATLDALRPDGAPDASPGGRGVFQHGSNRGETKNENARAPAAAGQPHDDLRSLIDTPAASKSSRPTRDNSPPPRPKLPDEPPQIALPEGNASTRLAFLRNKVAECPTCNAHLNPGGKIVFGSGNPSADIFFCGEAPGADEEKMGEPFVGKAGQLLDKIISAMGLAREEVYIANILNWRPQHDKPYGNRPPTLEEMRFCLPYLEAQIDVVRPQVIIALGNTAVTGLLGPDPKRKMGAIRGTWAQFKKIPMMITFHPSYLLRNGTLKTKRMVWEDMLAVMEQCNFSISDRQRGFFLPKQPTH